MKPEFWTGIPAYLRRMFDKYKYVLLVCLAGVALLLWPQGETERPAEPAQAAEEQTDQELELRLQELLESMEGVGQAKVVLTRENDGETDYVYDRTDSLSRTETGGTSSRQSQLATLSQSGGQAPVELRRRAPSYRGAVVACQGADSASVRLAVTQAVQSLTGLSADRIVITKMK